jgi:pyridoxine 4-dehydrogenase
LRWVELIGRGISHSSRINNRPIEEVIQTLSGFIKEGKFSHIGLSEASAETIRKAAKVHPISTVEVEFSLWSTEIKTNGVLDACQDLGIKIIGYSPLGRGILTGKFESPADVPEDLKRQFPRYADENFEENKKFVTFIKEIANRKRVSTAQVALKWILTQADGIIIPIPGATRAERVQENIDSANVDLTKMELDEINRFVETTEAKGGRYAEAHESALFA